MTKRLPKTRVPLPTLELIAQAQSCYITVIESFLPHITEPNQGVYVMAKNLALTQLSQILAEIAKRSSQQQADAVLDKIYNAAQPKEAQNEAK